jgi:hypothetical protein
MTLLASHLVPRHAAGEHSGSTSSHYKPPAVVRLGSLQTTLSGGGSDMTDFNPGTSLCEAGTAHDMGCP